MGTFSDRVLDLFFPRKCPFCHRLTTQDLPCTPCQETLPWLSAPRSTPHVEFVDQCACALAYEGAVQRCIVDLKFHGKTAALRVLGALTAQCVQDNFPHSFDLLTWVPLSRKSLWERGFDQSQLLAREVGRALGLKPTPLFVKSNHTQRQSTLPNAAARRANVLGAFTLRDPARVQGKRVLVVDDVITTGATLSECARLLRAAGAVTVLAAAPARGVGAAKHA